MTHSQAISDIPVPHPVFAEPVAGSLQLFVSGDKTQVHTFLRAAIHRQPDNLRRHVQHILGLSSQPQSSRSAVYGALLDLFIVLGDKGLLLRRRMLNIASAFLREGDVALFESHLLGGLSANTVLAFYGDSVLTAALSGTADVVAKHAETAQSQSVSVYEEALAQLEYGDVEHAALLLAQALKQQPEREDIAEALLAVYQHQQDQNALAGMRQWYVDNDLPLPACWPLL